MRTKAVVLPLGVEYRPDLRGPDPLELLTPRQLAKLLGITVQCLADWRCGRSGPKFIRLGGRAVRYRRLDVESFVAAGEVVTAAPFVPRLVG